MHKILLGIGTNIDACFNMRQATDYLLYYFPGIKFTSTIETDPFGPVYTAPFFNALAYFETDLSKDEIQLILKTIEKNMGRLPSHKSEGVIIIDIDLVQLNNETLKSDDFKRDYMQQLLREMEQIIGHQV
jgi:2-amino-4-hydroxy-6-hydroxymethyldihydropteridine diphosphokinase